MECNTRNKPNLVLQRSLVHDKLQENIARITWPYQLEAKMASYKQLSLKPNEIFSKKKTNNFLDLRQFIFFLENFPPFAIIFLFLNLLIACQVASYIISCKKLWAKISTKLFLPNFKVIFSLISGSNQAEFPFSVLSCVQWTFRFILAQAGVTFNTETYFSEYNSYL